MVESWTGFYLNAGLGTGMFNVDTVGLLPTGAPNRPFTDTQGGRGWFGTVGVGYDHQFTDRIVAGVFADVDFGSIEGTLQNQSFFTVGTLKLQSAWSAGARAGWLITPQILAYVNGGYTEAHFSSVDMIVNNVAGLGGAPFGTILSTVSSNTYRGWFAGGGMETKVAAGWHWRTEYRYASYDTATLADVCATAPCPVGAPIALLSIRPVVQTVRSELVYKFNSAGSQAYAGANAFASGGRQGWSGFYLNAGGGYGMFNADTTWLTATGAPFLPNEQTQGGRGWFGTLGGGYDHQFTDRIVAGVFADYDFASIEGTIQNQQTITVGTMTADAAWAVGARGGWLMTPEILSYFTAGFTQARFSSADMRVNINGGIAPLGTVVTTVPGHTYSGWFLGGGLEAKVASGWYWRNEYRYASYGETTLPDACALPGGCGPFPPGAPVRQVTVEPVIQTFRSALVFKFH
jgi:outer membrane immunogenic protein